MTQIIPASYVNLRWLIDKFGLQLVYMTIFLEKGKKMYHKLRVLKSNI